MVKCITREYNSESTIALFQGQKKSLSGKLPKRAGKMLLYFFTLAFKKVGNGRI